jgi:hypothetical protein
MATGQQNQNYNYFEVDDDSDSLSSLDSDGSDYPIERILAEFKGKNGHTWFLVKWQYCPLVRSSWECSTIFFETPWILDQWKVEKQLQAEGKSEPLDIAAFNKVVNDVEVAERQRRRLKSFRKQAQSILRAITAS